MGQRRSIMSFIGLLVILLTTLTHVNAAISLTAVASGSSSSVYFCKCICFSNYTILPLYRPADPAKPCLSCTKQFCLDQQLPICKDASKGDADPDTATGQEGDVQTKCFQRDSLTNFSVVMVFIFVTVSLLGGALVKQHFPNASFPAPVVMFLNRIWPSPRFQSTAMRYVSR